MSTSNSRWVILLWYQMTKVPFPYHVIIILPLFFVFLLSNLLLLVRNLDTFLLNDTPNSRWVIFACIKLQSTHLLLRFRDNYHFISLHLTQLEHSPKKINIYIKDKLKMNMVD